MQMTEIAEAVKGQLEVIQEFKTKIEGQIAEVKAGAEQAQKTANRAATFGAPGTAHESKMTQSERDQLTKAYSALIAGDQSTADQAIREFKSLTAVGDPGGAYFVSPTLSYRMARVAPDLSPISDLARTVNLTHGDSFEEPADIGELAASWVGEEDARPDVGDPPLAKSTIELHELYTQPRVTQKVLDVADIDIVGWLEGKIAMSFALAEGVGFVSGNGTLMPRGILDYTTSPSADASRTWGEIQYVPTGAAGAFDTNPADALIDLVMSLKPAYRPNAAWLMPRAVANLIRRFKLTDGAYIWGQSLEAGQPDRLLGFPVRYCEDLPAVAADSLSIAFGDFLHGYTVIRRPGIKMLNDPYTAKPYVRLYAHQRVGGAVTNFEAIKLLRFAAS